MIPFKEGNESGCWATSISSHALGTEVRVSGSLEGVDKGLLRYTWIQGYFALVLFHFICNTKPINLRDSDMFAGTQPHQNRHLHKN